jgi:hypothetical protein
MKPEEARTMLFHNTPEQLLTDWLVDLGGLNARMATMVQNGDHEKGKASIARREYDNSRVKRDTMTEMIVGWLMVKRIEKYAPLAARIKDNDPSRSQYFSVTQEGLYPQDVADLARAVRQLYSVRTKLDATGPGSYKEMVQANIDGYVMSPTDEQNLEEMRHHAIISGRQDLIEEGDQVWLDEYIAEAERKHREFLAALGGVPASDVQS